MVRVYIREHKNVNHDIFQSCNSLTITESFYLTNCSVELHMQSSNTGGQMFCCLCANISATAVLAAGHLILVVKI